MEYYNNILTIESNWLINEGIMSKSNYDQLRHRKDIQVVNRGCRNTPALVAFDNMPEGLQCSVRGMDAEAAIDNLEEALGYLEEACDIEDEEERQTNIDMAIDCLEDATL